MMTDFKYRVVEIFQSIEGEGLRAGLPCVFIRLYGCNCKCSYCDSQYACTGDAYENMTLDQILKKVASYHIPAVTITGGEPLIQNGIYNLVMELCGSNYWVNIETNGSMSIKGISDYRENNYILNLMITMDWKCKSSGMSDKMLLDNFKYLTNNDVLKFVVGSKHDLDQMKGIIMSNRIPACIFVSPVFGKIEPKDIVKYILDNNLTQVRVQLQLHKIIWDPTTRGV